MKNPSVYIETSIPSAYFEVRMSVQAQAVRDWTREWWDASRSMYECYSSNAVVAELNAGEHPEKDAKLLLLRDVALLEITREVMDIVDVYVSHYLMPKGDVGDAVHLAVASFYKMDFLLTWNCNHLANANKRAHIRCINERLHLLTPEIVTPLELTQETES